MAGFDLDPFANFPRTSHPALSEHHEFGFEIYEDLFENFFRSDEYQAWSSGQKTWPLHIFGGPGCGKSTLAALAVKRLRQTYKTTAVPVVSVFLEQDVSTQEARFLEDILFSIFQQLATENATVEGRTPDLVGTAFEIEHPSLYEQARQHGINTSHRIKRLRKALASKVSNVQHSFLVLDGYDRLNEGLQLLLDGELDQLKRGLHVILTRRVPQYQRVPDTSCDACSREVVLYWKCQSCSVENPRLLCYDCQPVEAACAWCGSAGSFVEPYDHVGYDIGRVPKESMHKFVAWSYERHYALSESNEDFSKIKESIVLKASGNVTMAKLRIETLHNNGGKDSIDKVADRLPSNIVTFFDAGFKRFDTKLESERLLALAGLVFAAGAANCISLGKLGTLIKRVVQYLTALTSQPPRSAEDVIAAANGFLVLDQASTDGEVSCYHTDLLYYVQENYNATLAALKKQLYEVCHPESAPPSRVLGSPRIVGSPSSIGTSWIAVNDALVLEIAKHR